MTDRPGHWNRIHARTPDGAASWHERTPQVSLDLIGMTGPGPEGWIVDVGGGASRLAGALAARGHRHLTVLDISPAALALAQRHAPDGPGIEWVAADVLGWRPPRRYALWHDRAAFHFLTARDERAAYLRALLQAVPPGAYAVIGTFAPDGPEHCCGLPVVRYDGPALMQVFGRHFALRLSLRHDHVTPGGAVQRFHFGILQRL